ncbi:MAG: hypothetical protein ACOYJ8_01540 [Patescibacteria group bacterium]|jgi:hypothetical protein
MAKSWFFKLLILVILIGALAYFFDSNLVKNWFGYSQVLGEEAGPIFEEKLLSPAKDVVNRHFRWPQKEDLEPLPRLVVEEKNQESPPSQAEFDQSLETLTEEIKKLPQQQLIKVKEQLIKEIFPDCHCVCE